MKEDKIIQNPFKGKFYPFYDQDFVRQVCLFDTAMVSVNGTVKEGTITFLSTRGVNVNLGNGDYFYKWCHVTAIKKKQEE